MYLIPPTLPTRTSIEQIVDAIIDGINDSFRERVALHKKGVMAVWASAFTPDDILAAMGTRAAMVLAASAASKSHIEDLSVIMGLTLDDVLPPEFQEPPRAYIPAQDGTVTLAPPAEGFDAWGNPIPTP